MSLPFDDFDNPDELFSHLWRRIADASTDRNSPFHLATFCTIDRDGSPAARQIIVRQVDVARRQIVFHTDRRSPKVEQIARESRVALLFWDANSRTQLRLSGTAAAESDTDGAKQLIASAHPGTLKVYRTIAAPSTPIAEPHAFECAPEPILTNLAIVTVSVMELEWLWLDDAGHRRCRFDLRLSDVAHQWLVP